MLRNLFEDLRIRYAIWRYGITKKHQHDLAVAFQAVETLRGMDADIQARLRHAALLEAHDVPEELVHLVCQVNGQGQLADDHLHDLERRGIELNFMKPAAMQERVQEAAKTERLQQAVKRLARIAGPGFTTDHLIDEGLIHEGDI